MWMIRTSDCTYRVNKTRENTKKKYDCVSNWTKSLQQIISLAITKKILHRCLWSLSLELIFPASAISFKYLASVAKMVYNIRKLCDIAVLSIFRNNVATFVWVNTFSIKNYYDFDCIITSVLMMHDYKKTGLFR